MPSIHDRLAVREFCRRSRTDPEKLRPFFAALYRKQMSATGASDAIDSGLAGALGKQFEFHSLDLDRRLDSKLDGATKLLFRTRGGPCIESVILRIATGRTTLCVSSQAGCAVGCAFCATGKMGLAGNLSMAEIVDQVIQANEILKTESRQIRNVVFMGMGEPFHNETRLHHALDLLTAPDGFNFDQRRILISTSGIPAAMLRLAQKYPEIRLALSLHSAKQQIREQLVPLAQRYPLETLRTALEQIVRLQNREIMIEYVLLSGVNDTDSDRAALAEYLHGLPVHLNVIPFNPIDSAPHLRPSPRETENRFSTALKTQGFKVTTRYSLGSDIAAACGQLATQRGQG